MERGIGYSRGGEPYSLDIFLQEDKGRQIYEGLARDTYLFSCNFERFPVYPRKKIR